MIDVSSAVRTRIILYSYLLPLLAASGVVYLCTTGNPVWDLLLGLSLVTGYLFRKGRYLVCIEPGNGTITLHYLTLFFGKRQVHLDTGRISSIKCTDARFFTASGKLQIRYKGVWQTYQLSDRELVVFIQEHLDVTNTGMSKAGM